MTRLERARGAHGEGDTFVTNHRLDKVTRPLYRWASEFWWIRESAQVAASLALDGYPARGPCRLAITNLYPGNTFKDWGRI